MIKIINNRMYDTLTATTLFSIGEIDLMQTPRGAFFLACKESESVRILTATEARDFLRKAANIYLEARDALEMVQCPEEVQ